MILANSLSLSIVILDERDDGALNKIVQSPGGGHIACFFIRRKDDHFNGLIPVTNPQCPGALCVARLLSASRPPGNATIRMPTD